MSSGEISSAENVMRVRAHKAEQEKEVDTSLNSSSHLRIAVIGGGRIGSAFAFYLIKNGHHDVTIVARPYSTRLEQLKRDCGIITSDGEHVAATITDSLDVNVPYDLILVTVLGHQIEGLLPSLRLSTGKTIHFFFNTFVPEHLQQAVGLGRAALGMPFIQSNLDTSGRLTATVGRGGQRSLTSDPKWADIFQAAGLPAQFESKMALWLRCHAPLCVAFESISVTGERRGGGAPWHSAYALALGIRACFRLIRSEGYEIYPRGKAWMEWLPVTLIASMLWTLSRVTSFRVLLATGEKECRALVNVMVESGEKVEGFDDCQAILAMKP